MLILTRHIGKLVRINDNITVRVIGMNTSQTVLAFEAPKEVKIIRGELINPVEAAQFKKSLKAFEISRMNARRKRKAKK